ncbi:MAG: BBP7 family outer membrane beta-barrel protein [Planctomycetia bacterium]
MSSPIPCPSPRAAAIRRLAVVAALLGGPAAAQQPLPQPPPAPPMYIPDPVGAGGLAGMPPAVAADMLPDWPRWFAGASGLVMTRTLPDGAATMAPLGGVQLTTADAAATWPGGIDVHIGRWFGGRQQHAVEFIYWGVYGLGTSDSETATPAAIDAIPQAPGVTIGGTSAATFLQDAAGQTIGRADVVNDVEINWVYSLWERPEFLPQDRRVTLMWLAGFRYFGLGDTLSLTTTPGNPALGPPLLTVATANSIYGAQVGAKFDWLFLPGLRLDIVPKFMIGGNAVTNTTSLAAASGDLARFESGTPVTVHQTLGVFSWLGSVDTGLAWDVTEHWTLALGYRVVGVGNIAQADGQWPVLLATPGSIPGLSASSSTIVHGAFAGFEARY